MTGTLLPNFWELRKVYRLWTTWVPTNRPGIRDVHARPRLSRPRTRSSTPWSQKTQRDARGRPAGADRHAVGGDVEEALGEADRRRASRTRCSTPSRTSSEAEIVAAGRAAGHGDGGDEHGRPRHRHQARRRRRGGRRAARHRHRAARGGADRPPADRPRRPAGRPRHRGVHALAGGPAARRARHAAQAELAALGRRGGNRDWNALRRSSGWPSGGSRRSTTSSGST